MYFLEGMRLDLIFMYHLESIVLINPPVQLKIGFYYRYVDDCVLLLNATTQNLNESLELFNTIHPKIFTMEPKMTTNWSSHKCFDTRSKI